MNAKICIYCPSDSKGMRRTASLLMEAAKEVGYIVVPWEDITNRRACALWCLVLVEDVPTGTEQVRVVKGEQAVAMVAAVAPDADTQELLAAGAMLLLRGPRTSREARDRIGMLYGCLADRFFAHDTTSRATCSNCGATVPSHFCYMCGKQL